MHNTVHIDEKWFYTIKIVDKCYLLPNELEPYKACKQKRFITNIIFFCVMGGPHIACDGEVVFYGKFGIFSFKTMVQQREILITY